MAFPTFAAYAASFGKVYNGDEWSRRETIYNQAIEEMTAHNARFESGEETYTEGVNRFTDMTLDEFQQSVCGEEAEEEELPLMGDNSEDVEVASSQDWSGRTDIVNPIKNQGSCGSCWAFGANAVLETEFALTTGTLHNLAEQQLVDCDTYSSGCNGGLSRYSFSGYYKSHGACSTASYAYTARDGTCKDTSCNVLIPSGVVTGYSQISGTISALQTALMSRPLKVSVYGDSVWQGYNSGIANPTQCYSGTNHAVMAVGFDAGSYWKIRNSWGQGWGEAGYIRLTQTSSCSTGPSSIFGRTPIYPTLSALNVAV